MKQNTEIRVRGFARAQIKDKKGKIVGDSGWCQNTVTNYGLNNACAGCAIAATGSTPVRSAVLATQTDAVNVTHISMIGVENQVEALTPSTVATGTARVTGSFAGANNSATLTIGAIGLHLSSNSATDLIAGVLFTTSQMATNQDLDFTYELRFS
jgi:hypothetical protein